MSDNNIELSRRRILAGLGTIGVASAATGAGTMALFSDEESSSGNVVQAGTLDLTLGNGGAATLTASEVAPGDGPKRAAVAVTNNGSIDGSLDVAISNVNSQNRNPEPEQRTNATRTFDIYYGSDNQGNQLDLNDELGGIANVEIDLSGSTYVFTADLPYALTPTGQFDDSITFAFDADNDGIEDFQLAVRDHDDDDEFEIVYDDASALPNGSRSRNQDLPTGYDARLENGNKRFVAEVPASDLSDPFAVTGQANLAAYSPSTSGSNLAIPLMPGFGYNNPPIAGTSSFDGHATKMVEIKSDKLRTLADLLDVSVYISSDGSKSSDDTFVTAGKLNRLPLVEPEPNKSLPSGATNYVIIEYELSPNVGNAVQADSVSFDLDVTLNQRDTQ